VLVVPTERSDEAALERIEHMWQAVGARTRRIDAETHDRLLARTSHLPHLVAGALVEALGDGADDLVATGFLDTTRVASGDPGLWRDIFMTNADELLRAVERFEAAIDRIKSALGQADQEAVRRFLEAAKSQRDKLLDRR
jgi:prephenate dehydrogenase